MRLFIAFLLATLMTAPQLSAEQITARSPKAVVSAMRAYGMIATLDTDDYGDPMIESRISQSRFYIFFYDCEQSKDCRSIQFRSSYVTEGSVVLEQVNEWNRDRRFGKAYLDDDNDAVIEMDLNLDFDGVGAENFEDSLDYWRVIVEQFEDFISWDAGFGPSHDDPPLSLDA